MSLCCLFAGGGFFLSRKLPVLYTSTSTFIPAASGGGSIVSELMAQTSLLGALGGGGGDMHLEEVIASRDFLEPFLAERWPVDTSGVTHSMVEIFGIETDSVKGINLRADSAYLVKEMCIGKLRKAVKVLIDGQTSVVSLSVSTKDPVFSYALDSAILERIRLFHNGNRIDKAVKKRMFIETQMRGFEENLATAERRLTNFRLQNQVIDSPELEAQRNRLEREVQIATSIVIEFRKQLEMARLDEHSDKDYIDVFEKPSIPLGPSSLSPRKLIGFGAFFGLFLGLVIALFRMLSKKKA